MTDDELEREIVLAKQRMELAWLRYKYQQKAFWLAEARFTNLLNQRSPEQVEKMEKESV